MRIDPRIGLTVSLLICAAAALWLLAQWFASDAIGESQWPVEPVTHAITFLALFALVACPFVALLFYRYLRVKAHLLGGRNVIARWTVDSASLKEFNIIAEARERAEKREALYVMFFFIVLLFGAMALLSLEVAVPVLLAAAALAMVMTIVFCFDNRIRENYSQMRSAEIIIGTEGLLFDDVLHVWSTFISWLVAAQTETGPPPVFTITYAFGWGRNGPQFVSVIIPIGPDHWDLAVTVEQRLQQPLYKRSASARRGRRTFHMHSHAGVDASHR